MSLSSSADRPYITQKAGQFKDFVSELSKCIDKCTLLGTACHSQLQELIKLLVMGVNVRTLFLTTEFDVKSYSEMQLTQQQFQDIAKDGAKFAFQGSPTAPAAPNAMTDWDTWAAGFLVNRFSPSAINLSISEVLQRNTWVKIRLALKPHRAANVESFSGIILRKKAQWDNIQHFLPKDVTWRSDDNAAWLFAQTDLGVKGQFVQA